MVQLFPLDVTQAGWLESFLVSHLPYSLTILANLPVEGSNAKVNLWTTFPNTGVTTQAPSPFSVFLTNKRDNQTRFFCSEDSSSSLPLTEHNAHVIGAILQWLNIATEAKFGLKIGSIHEKWISILEPYTEITLPYTKFFYTLDFAPADDSLTLTPEFRIGPIALEDVDIVTERSSRFRTREYIVSRLPTSVCIKTAGVAIAWVLVHGDGSIGTLHVEDNYRRQGFAALLMREIIKTNKLKFGDRSWNWVDVGEDNVLAQKLFTRLPGWEVGYTSHWLLLASK